MKNKHPPIEIPPAPIKIQTNQRPPKEYRDGGVWGPVAVVIEARYIQHNSQTQEGERNGKHTALYDLYRLENGKIVEHWDTTETVAPKDQWKNDNGKF